MGWLALLCFAVALLLAYFAWWEPRRQWAACARAVRAIEASRVEEGVAVLTGLRGSVRGPLAVAVELNLGIAALRAGRATDAGAHFARVVRSPAAPESAVHAALCHSAIVLALCGTLADAEEALAAAHQLHREALAPSQLPLVAANPEVYRLAEAVVWLHAHGTLPSALLDQQVNVIALDAHSMTGLRVLRAFARHLAGDAEQRVLEELLAVAQHGRPQEFAYLTAGVPRLRSFLLTRAA